MSWAAALAQLGPVISWSMQILHSMTTRGDMSFQEINLVVPNIEAAQDFGIDLSAPTLHPPRVLWSHLWYPDLPKGIGTKYIYVTRGEWLW